MKRKSILSLIIISILIISCSSDTDQIDSSPIYPNFGAEIDVTINGLSFDAMEPFISSDGKYLFFNNLNDGVDTKLFYATRVDDSTFTYVGELGGTNQAAPPHLDAVADMDALGNFYSTSTREYPSELNNLFHGTYNTGAVSNIGRVYGDFNKNTPGWLIMDHGISQDGKFLYANNARFDDNSCQGACETTIDIAHKANDSTFNVISKSSEILQYINDSNYIYYAPTIWNCTIPDIKREPLPQVVASKYVWP